MEAATRPEFPGNAERIARGKAEKEGSYQSFPVYRSFVVRAFSS
jgi:hypothetical protein